MLQTIYTTVIFDKSESDFLHTVIIVCKKT